MNTSTTEVRETVGEFLVLRYTAKAGGYEGVVIATRFSPSKEGQDRTRGGFYEVVATNASEEEMSRLVRQTPPHARLLAVLDDATNPNGKVNCSVLKHKLVNIVLAIKHGHGPVLFPVPFAGKSPAAVLLLNALYDAISPDGNLMFDIFNHNLKIALEVIGRSDLTE